MIDLGEKPPKPLKHGQYGISEPQTMRYPSLSIGNEYGDSKIAYDIPISQKDDGKTITATVRLTVTRVVDKTENGKKNKYCVFDVKAIEFHGKDGGESKRVGSAERHATMTKELKKGR